MYLNLEKADTYSFRASLKRKEQLKHVKNRNIFKQIKSTLGEFVNGAAAAGIDTVDSFTGGDKTIADMYYGLLVAKGDRAAADFARAAHGLTNARRNQLENILSDTTWPNDNSAKEYALGVFNNLVTNTQPKYRELDKLPAKKSKSINVTTPYGSAGAIPFGNSKKRIPYRGKYKGYYWKRNRRWHKKYYYRKRYNSNYRYRYPRYKNYKKMYWY